MDFAEFGKIAAALKTYYPKEQNLLPTQEAVKLWHVQLKDIPYEVAAAALQKWVATHKWSPSIAEFRQEAMEITTGGIDDWSDAWEKVMKAVRRYGTWGTREALESFDDITREAVKRIGFYNICMSDNLTADRANFRGIYQGLAERKKQNDALPVSLRDYITKMQIGQIEKTGGDDEKDVDNLGAGA